MDRILPSDTIRPGAKALSLVDHTLHGTKESEPYDAFTCIINQFQTVEINSEPGWVSDELGTFVPVISIKVPDINGVDQSIGIELDLLLVAANNN